MSYSANILIVDDTPAGRITLDSLLRKEGHNLYFAEDGIEALELADRIVPDLILLDVMMPEVNGFEVCKAIRSNPHLKEIPIVMVTVLDNREARIQGIESGADDFISKPFDKEELRARVNTIIRLNRYRIMQAEKAKFEWAVVNSDDGYVIIDENDEIQFINPTAEQLLNIHSSVNNKKFKSIIKEHYLLEPAHSWEIWPPKHESEKNYRYLVRQETFESPALWLELTVLENPTQLKIQYLLRIRDITKEMINQRNIRSFQAMVSHKMKTPLTTMMYSFEFLKRKTAKYNHQELIELIDNAQSDLSGLQKEIESIIEYVDSAHVRVIDDAFDFCRIDDIIGEIKKDIDYEKISVNKKIKNQKIHTSLTKLSLKWILIEIFENSIKFHPQKSPTIVVELEMIRNRLLLSVTDDGINVPIEEFRKVWKPYYQIEKHFTGQIPGMGLGLSIVESFIWESGGECKIRNRTDIPGVIIELYIPVNPE